MSVPDQSGLLAGDPAKQWATGQGKAASHRGFGGPLVSPFKGGALGGTSIRKEGLYFLTAPHLWHVAINSLDTQGLSSASQI